VNRAARSDALVAAVPVVGVALLAELLVVVVLFWA
jgi:hypothetical protein